MEENEIWVDILGYEEFYKVSSFGNIFSKRRGKNMNLKLEKKGYRRVNLVDENNKSKSFMVHRLVAIAFVENEEGKEQVNHKNKNKEYNRSSNLEWVSNSENVAHRYNYLKDLFTSLIRKEINRLIPIPS